MNCPKCGFEQAENAPDCARCGIVLAKARRPAAPPPPAVEVYIPPSGRYAQRPAENSGGAWKNLVMLTLAIGLVAGGIALALLLNNQRESAGNSRGEADAGAGTARHADARPGSPAVQGQPPPQAAVQPRAQTRPPVDFEMLLLTAHPVNGTVKTSYPEWHEDFAGFKEAERARGPELAPMLVYFYTDWCPHCKYVSTSLWPNATVGASLDHVVKVRVNAEAGDAEGVLQKTYGRTSIPTCYYHAAGERTYKMISCSDPMTPADFANQMSELATGGASIAQADALRKAGRLQQALAMADRVTADRPDDAQNYLFRGYIQRDIGNAAAAEQDFLIAVNLDPHNLWPYRGLDDLWVKAGRAQDVTAAWSHFLQFEPRSGEGYLERAGAWRVLGEMDHAREDLQRGCKSGENRACTLLQQLGPTPAAGVRS